MRRRQVLLVSFVREVHGRRRGERSEARPGSVIGRGVESEEGKPGSGRWMHCRAHGLRPDGASG